MAPLSAILSAAALGVGFTVGASVVKHSPVLEDGGEESSSADALAVLAVRRALESGGVVVG